MYGRECRARDPTATEAQTTMSGQDPYNMILILPPGFSMVKRYRTNDVYERFGDSPVGLKFHHY